MRLSLAVTNFTSVSLRCRLPHRAVAAGGDTGARQACFNIGLCFAAKRETSHYESDYGPKLCGVGHSLLHGHLLLADNEALLHRFLGCCKWLRMNEGSEEVVSGVSLLQLVNRRTQLRLR